jgi:hypothetical protein
MRLGWCAGCLVAGLAACARSTTPSPEVTGTLTVDDQRVVVAACRPRHGVHVFVELETREGTLRFGEGKLFWNGTELACTRLERSWGGGIRADDSAYFRGTLAFSCGKVAGDLTLDCGAISADERGELDKNRAAARAGSAN